MKTEILNLPAAETVAQKPPSLIPLWLKIAYTAFMAVLIPVYWYHYGPSNFLYFCDVALLVTLVGIWTESPMLISMSAVGILIPQAIWVLDFLFELSAHSLTGMTGYMFEAHRPLYLRGLSLFHGWLPFLLIYLVRKLGYERKALAGWILTSIVLCLLAYFCFPPAGAELADPKLPRNINYVFGLDDAKPQSYLPPGQYLIVWIGLLCGLFYVPTHFVLKRFFRKPL